MTSDSTKAPPSSAVPISPQITRLDTVPFKDDGMAESLLREAAKGDESAFKELINTHSRRLYAIAYSILQNQTEAEEVVQDTFVKAHRELKNIRSADKFPGWLNLVARNAARDLFRRRRPQAEASVLDQMADQKVPVPSARMDEAHVQNQLKQALASLPEEHRTAITLRYLEGLDYQGIETTMGLTNGALRGILGRALASLRKRLQPLQLERSSL